MSENFDFIVVGGGSAGAVIAARLSEDPACRVALLEAGERPPEVELMPVACAAMQLNPATDWMYTADPGEAGLGLRGRRVPVPRGKMLGGSSGLNYMAYVRGHPGDFDSWAEGGATGWSYADVLPYFRKSEGLAPCDEIVIDGPAHNNAGPLGSRPEGVQTAVQGTVGRFGAIDILVHNAGIFPFRPLEEMEERDWSHVLEVNLTSAFRLTKACLPHMKERRNGRVLFTSSVTGNRTGVGGLAHYSAAKAGINGFIRSVALELAPYGITVNGVEPGLVLTSGSEAVTTAEERDAMARFVPLKRWGTPTDIAHAMLYLASEWASYVTGQTIVVDGGALLPENGALMM